MPGILQKHPKMSYPCRLLIAKMRYSCNSGTEKMRYSCRIRDAKTCYSCKSQVDGLIFLPVCRHPKSDAASREGDRIIVACCLVC